MLSAVHGVADGSNDGWRATRAPAEPARMAQSEVALPASSPCEAREFAAESFEKLDSQILKLNQA